MILFYDSNTYKVGDKKKNYIELTSQKEINQLNFLQFLNCERTIYFNNEISNNYLLTLKNKLAQFSKGSITNSQILDRINEKGEKMEDRSLIWLSANSIDINLAISNITLTKKIKISQFDNSKPNIRPRTIPIISQYHR